MQVCQQASRKSKRHRKSVIPLRLNVKMGMHVEVFMGVGGSSRRLSLMTLKLRGKLIC